MNEKSFASCHDGDSMRVNGATLALRRTALPSAVLGLALLAAACAGGDNRSAVPTESSTDATVERDEPAPSALAAGTFRVPAAASFGDPGFHEPVLITSVLPEELDSTADRTIVLALRDVTRPQQDCSREHPLSGCATVDWSDHEDRPNVPPGGVFDNRITLQLASGPLTVFLSESGDLAAAPDSFQPG